MRNRAEQPDRSKSIRTNLQAALAVIVAISLTAVLFSWVSVANTREKLDVIVSETLPLISNSLKLDKYAQLFALYIREFHEINTDEEHESLTKRLDMCIGEIENLLINLQLLKFDNLQIHRIRTQTNQLVDAMIWQIDQFHVFSETSNTLQAAVSTLREKQHDFISVTSPHIDNSYKDFIEKSEKVSVEMRQFVSNAENNTINTDISQLDNKMRVAFDTLVSSAAGEMRYTLEAVALTYLASSFLYEAASSQNLDHIDRLEHQFQQLIPKMKTIRLVLSHSTPQKYDVVLSALPIFNFGTDKTATSIFNLRRQELLLRAKAAESAENALHMGKELTASLEDLNSVTEELAAKTSRQLHTSLQTAQAVQVVLGISAIIFSLLIAWVYIEKAVIKRISHLRIAMESSSTSGDIEDIDIPTSGSDEITAMARALHAFVDQRRAAESKILTTLEELHAVLDNIDYGIVFLDNELSVQLTNRAFLEMWQISAEQLPAPLSLNQLLDARMCKDIHLPSGEQLNWHPDNLMDALCSESRSPIEMETRDGRFFQHQCFELGQQGKMLTFFDITDFKENQRRLVQAQKTETIGLMAGGVAHDLNNILSGIVSYPDLLLTQLPENSTLRPPIEAIKASGQRAAAVVADLLTITRGGISQKEVTNINPLIIEYLRSPEGMQLKERYPDITISTELSTTSLNCKCAPVQIKKCLMNIIVNAAEAIEDRGKIVIATQMSNIHAHPHLPKDLTGVDLMVLTIRDDGPGISSDDIEHIFEPFYSRKVMGRSGTGLGLTIVWNTLKEHGGTVTVESDENGTQFQLFLPLMQAFEPQQEDWYASPEIRGRREHILVVDDEPLQRDLATRMLHSLNYQVTTVSSGEEAVQRIRKRSFDLVLLDMIMSPGINGRETYEQIIDIRPKQKAIIASGYSGSEDIDIVRSLGATESLLKPYTMKQLGEAVKIALTS